ncbi:MAG: mechanosensitive ion channel, partial [Akkermansiaceae bacterium]
MTLETQLLTVAAIGDSMHTWLETAKGALDIFGPAGKYILAVIVFIIGRYIAKSIRAAITAGLSKTDLDDKLAKYMGHNSGAGKGIANFIYYILLLFLAILALDFAELNHVSQPLEDLLAKFLNFIPNLIGAGVLLYFVIIVATVVKNLASNVLSAAKVDEKLGSITGASPISKALATALYSFIILLFIPSVLALLKLDSISEPVGDVVAQILSAVPEIIIASVLVGIGIIIGRIASRLVVNLLDAAGANSWPSKVGLSFPSEGKGSVSGIVGLIVMISITVLMVGAAINQLSIKMLEGASEVFVNGYFNVLIAVIILGAGILLANMAYRNLADKNV